MKSVFFAVVIAITLPALALAEEISGYAEFRKAPELVIVDGQRVLMNPSTRFQGARKTMESIQLGDVVKVEGYRLPDGKLVARRLQANPGNPDAAEQQMLKLTDDQEQKWLSAGAIVEKDDKGKETNQGKVITSGKLVDRCRAIVKRVKPSYYPREMRVYVVENKEWNAFAMANGSIWVYTGILADMNDDEMAIVLGHEMAHVTQEHSAKQMKKASPLQMIFGGVAAASQAMGNATARQAAQLGAGLGASMMVNKYSRSDEDQADRVGLRYAYEGGYKASVAPQLWQRFEQKYGKESGFTNFLFGGHSTSAARIKNLQQQIALNYR